jgi:hypothetical protein
MNFTSTNVHIEQFDAYLEQGISLKLQVQMNSTYPEADYQDHQLSESACPFR